MADYSTQEKMGIFPYDTRYRPIAPPDTGIFDEPRASICVNVKWIAHLDGVIERLLWADAWAGDDDAKQFATGEITKLLSAMMIRVPCGDDMACCDDLIEKVDKLIENSKSEILDKIALWQQALADLLADFTSGGINSIAPNTEYDASPDDEDRDNALCFVCQQYVNQVCNYIKAGKQDADNQFDDLLGNVGNLFEGAGVVGAAAAVAGLAVSGWMLLGFAIVAVTANALALITSADTELFDDEDARHDVACCMNDALAGHQPDLSEFQASLSGCTLAGSSEELRAIVDAFNQSQDAFLQFMALWSEAVPKNALLPECDCGTDLAPAIGIDPLATCIPGVPCGINLAYNSGSGIWEADGEVDATTNTMRVTIVRAGGGTFKYNTFTSSVGIGGAGWLEADGTTCTAGASLMPPVDTDLLCLTWVIANNGTPLHVGFNFYV